MIASTQDLHSEVTRPSAATGRSDPTGRDTLDHALIERIAAGDRTAMNVLYTRHNARVYRFILRFVGNGAVAEELVNEVFLGVWRSAGKFEGRSQVSTWLLALARHQALDARGRRSTVPLDDDALALVEDPAANAEAIVDRKNTGSILRNCLAQLPPIHREIIDLVYYHGKTIDDAAAIIGIKQGTVKTRMFYARRRLAELLRARGIVGASA
jgi:RNA polymerase sigma-70 factor, ECF subfamily